MLSFRTLSICVAITALILCLAFLFAPNILFSLFGVEVNSSALFIGRRAGMLFLGLTLLAWFSRNISHSESRSAISLSIMIAMIGLVLLGMLEYLRGFASEGIFLAILIEAFFAYCYFKIWFQSKNEAKLVYR